MKSKSETSAYHGTTKRANVSQAGNLREVGGKDKLASAVFSALPASREPKAMAGDSPAPEPLSSSKLPSSRYVDRIPQRDISCSVFRAIKLTTFTHSIPAVDELFDMLRPPAPCSLFTGRAKELEYIDTFFRQNSHDGEFTLRGVTGSGKTQLALKFAQVTTLHR